ncbi:MAG: MipA/OmpV family protein [Pseudomonadota bacterium]
MKTPASSSRSRFATPLGSALRSRGALCAALVVIPAAVPSALSAENGETMAKRAGSNEAPLGALDFELPSPGPAPASDTVIGLPQDNSAQLRAPDPQPNQPGGQPSAQGQPSQRPSGPNGPRPKPVFDENWATIGIGAGLVPSYSGSDDYIVFPLPLVVGRVGGVGLRPNGAGVRLDFLSPAPALGPRQETTFNFGPSIRFRNDRANQIEDEVVELAEDLDVALEVGLAGGVTFPGVFNPSDSLTFNTGVSFDVLGAHDGFLIEPTIGYARPFGRGVLFQANVGAQFVDDNFADYYYTVTPEQSAATGLALFTADGGLNSVSSNMVVNVDLDGNALNGGLSVYTILGYSRLVGDAADTPFTTDRGDANQFIAGLGLAYTF